METEESYKQLFCLSSVRQLFFANRHKQDEACKYTPIEFTVKLKLFGSESSDVTYELFSCFPETRASKHGAHAVAAVVVGAVAVAGSGEEHPGALCGAARVAHGKVLPGKQGEVRRTNNLRR